MRLMATPMSTLACMLLQARAEQAFRKGLTAEDAPGCLQLVLHDAATYDIASGTGGLNGSIVLP